MARTVHDPEVAASALRAQWAILAANGVAGPADPAEITDATGRCLDAVLLGLDHDPPVPPEPSALKLVVRALLDRLVTSAPGRSVEVRIPPYAAAQCVAGPRHTRGTPPNTVETDPLTWLAVATGRAGWQEAVAQGRIRASGERADLSSYLPLTEVVSTVAAAPGAATSEAPNRVARKGRQHEPHPLS